MVGRYPPLGNASAGSRSGTRLSAAVARALREGLAIAIAMAALVLLVALLGFDARDPGFSYSGTGEPVHNGVGSVGA